MQFERESRVLGVVPTSTSRRKRIGSVQADRSSRLAPQNISRIPSPFALPGVSAGIEQSQNSFSGYGQGAAGIRQTLRSLLCRKRTSAYDTTRFLPELLRQDPLFTRHGSIVIARSTTRNGLLILWQGRRTPVTGQPNYSKMSSANWPNRRHLKPQGPIRPIAPIGFG